MSSMVKVDTNPITGKSAKRLGTTIQLRVEKASDLEGIVQSAPKIIGNIPWRLRVMPTTDSTGKKEALGVFLVCDREPVKSFWSHPALATFRLLPQKARSTPYCRRMAHEFHAAEKDWGYTNFLEWSPLNISKYIDPTDDHLDIEADVVVDFPCGQKFDFTGHKGDIGAESPNGTLKCKMKLSDLNVNWQSQTIYARGLSWRLEFEPLYGIDNERPVCWDVFLRCVAKGNLENMIWKCDATVTVDIIAKRGYTLFSKSLTKSFDAVYNIHAGFENFIDRETLTNRDNGFIKYTENIEIVVSIEAKEVNIAQAPEVPAPSPETGVMQVNLQSCNINCPICAELPRAEVFQCRNGHIVCNICIDKLNDTCPVCRVKYGLSRIRNRAFEAILNDVRMVCC